MRIVVDTNVLISATWWLGNARELLIRASKGDVTIIISNDILDEYCDVIRRKKFSFIQEKWKKRFVFLMLEHIKVVSVKSVVKAIKEDPEDNMVLSCAKAVKADLIVTGDSHLLRIRAMVWNTNSILPGSDRVDQLIFTGL